MNSNIFLKLFGLNPDDFEFTYDGPIDCDDGYIVDLTQLIKPSQRVCPECKGRLVIPANCLEKYDLPAPPGPIIITRFIYSFKIELSFLKSITS